MVQANAVSQADCAAEDARKCAELCYFGTGESSQVPTAPGYPARNGLMEDLGGDADCDWVAQREMWGEEDQGETCIHLDRAVQVVVGEARLGSNVEPGNVAPTKGGRCEALDLGLETSEIWDLVRAAIGGHSGKEDVVSRWLP